MKKTFVVVNRHFSVVLETSEDISLGGAEHRIMDGNTWIKQCQAFKVRDILKGEAFHWSPSQNAWQRQLTNNARYALKNILKKLKGGVE